MFLLFQPQIANTTEYVILNPQIQQAPGKKELRQIFTLRKHTWPDKTRIQVFVLPQDNPIHKKFTKNVLGIFAHRLKRQWQRLIFTGTGQAPIQVEDESEMRKKVAKTPGAIGYISEKMIDSSVKTLIVK